MPKTHSLVLAALLALMPAAVLAQSLADVAKQESERRTTVKPGKRLTNADLKADFTTPVPPPAETTAPAAGSSPVGPGNATPAGPAAAAAPEDTATPEPPKEAFWRARAAALRAGIVKATAAVASLTGASHADARIQERADLMLKQAQDTLARAQEALRLFEAEAAAAKVPADWIR
jgi:hypothetical protein